MAGKPQERRTVGEKRRARTPEHARENWKGTRIEKQKGGECYLWTLGKRQSSCKLSLPDRGAAKPGEADRMTEII